jgi:hypothetical protein
MMAEIMEAPVLHDDDEDDDDMANLFSFGSGDGLNTTESNDLVAAANRSSSSLLLPNDTPTGRKEADSPDSFLEMLTAESSGIIVLEGGVTASHDQETQDILDWLDDDDDTEGGRAEVLVFESKLTPLPVVAPLPSPEPTVVALPPTFATFQEALVSKESTVQQVRTLFVKEQGDSDESILVGTQRAELYCRMVCHKSLEDTVGSSLADSFGEWKKTRLEQEDDSFTSWVRQHQLSQRIAQQTGRAEAECETDLIDLVLNHHHQKKSAPSTTTENGESLEEMDVLLPTVAAALLSAGIPVAGAAVMLSQIIPNFMPLLALPPGTERWEAALSLHSEFYLLACYHVPLLVFHLDRYLPGWHWPKLPDQDQAEASAVSIGRNLKKQGQLPPSWLLSHLAGECGGTMLPTSTLLMLWDGILTGQNNATRFFLSLAVLERSAETLLLLTGEELAAALRKVWTLEDIDKNKEPEDKDWRHEWWPHALCLQTSTPESVLDRLKKVEDEAVQYALLRRQERAEAALRARLEAEAAAFREAQELKAEEARQRLTRARLVAFYRKHAPEKESNIDKIVETFTGRWEELDAKLKLKYGEGFNPAIKAKVQNKLIATMNQGFIRKRSVSMDDDDEAAAAPAERKPDKVSVAVAAEEVLPVVCWSKEAQAARGIDQSRRKRSDKNRKPLKFYLVDSRSQEAAHEQGRFPTAVSLSPEAMLDPERLQENEEMFESLRGAVHIVIMGEGFNAVPNLYNQKLSPKLQELMEQDESRTNMCALFFQKRGFCFVSLLDGGFCAAHSWLVREGPKHHLNASAVLVDYNPESTLFGQLETLHNASAAEKAQRKMANLLEASILTMTKRAYQLERLTSDFDTKEGRQGLRISLFGRSESTADDSVDGYKNTVKGKRDEPVPNAENTETVAANSTPGTVSTEATPPATSNEKVPGPSESSPVASSTPGAPNPLGKFLPGGASKHKEEASNPFKGFGAAFNNTRARFGVAAGSAQPESAGRGGGGGFGGFNQLRKTTMSMMRSANAKDEHNEEAVSNGHDAEAANGTK